MKWISRETGSILDLLKKQHPESSKSTLRSWLEQERVMVEGRVVRLANHPVQTGESIEIGHKVQFLRGDIRLLYEDAHLVVIVKPEGLLSVATDFETHSAHAILKRRKGALVYPVQRLE
jgi:23S rRNA pseudouridine1911/1915/1917 synthase